MASKSTSLRLTYVIKSHSLHLPSHESANREKFLFRFLKRRVLAPLCRFRLFLVWLIFELFIVLPIVLEDLRPIWRLLCWIAPTILAVEVDAGYTHWVYLSKFVIWILQTSVCARMLFLTDGFKRAEQLCFSFFFPVVTVLFLVACVLTIVGSGRKRLIPLRTNFNNNLISRYVQAEASLRNVDKTIYATFGYPGKVLSRLTADDFKDAWVADNNEDGRRPLTDEEICQQVIWISYMTQFVVSRVFKDVTNNVFVYSPVTQYRTIIIIIALSVAGGIEVCRALFENTNMLTSVVLWLTLPAVTLPQTVRVKFGVHANVLLLLGGFLPVDTDERMWKRLGISAKDLYAALTNAFSAEKVLTDKVGPEEGHGVSKVKAMDVHEANGFCVQSLLSIGTTRARVSDGKRFRNYGPRKLLNLSQLHVKESLRVRFPEYREDIQEKAEKRLEEAFNWPTELLEGSSKKSVDSASLENNSDQEVPYQNEFILPPDTRTLHELVAR